MKQTTLLLIAMTLCRWASAQSVVKSYQPELLARQLIEQKAKDENNPVTIGLDSVLYVADRLEKELKIDFPVDACEETKARRARLDGVHEAGFVQMYCGEDLTLVFSVKTDQNWRYLQTGKVPNKYGEATTSVASVTGDASQQVLIHMVQFMSGTGLGQRNFMIYKLVDGKIRVVLNEVEKAWTMYPWTDHETEQHSTFVFTPPEHDSKNGTDSAATFEETQTVFFEGREIELKRDLEWVQEYDTFLPDQWYSARVVKAPDRNSHKK